MRRETGRCGGHGSHDTSCHATTRPHRNGATPTPPVLHIAGLSKTFGATRALIDASLDIQPGEIHALVGQNGSGKSTLIKTLAGYHTPDPGSRGRARRRRRSTSGTRCPTGCASSTRTSASCSSSTRWTTSRCTAASLAERWAACAGASRSRRPTASSPASASISTSTARWPPQRRSSGPWSRSPRRCRAGRAAAACSCSTSRRRSCRTTRSSGCSRWSARCGARARACSTSRTVSTRSSSWPTA